MKTKKSKSILALLFSVVFLIPVMFALTGCGGELEQKATCNTNQRYTSSSAEEFVEKTTGKGDFTRVSSMAGGYRLTVESNAEGMVGPEGYQTKYSMNSLTNAIIRLNSVDGNQLGLKTVVDYDIVGMKGKMTAESYVKNNNLYVHTLPTTIESNHTKVQISEQKLMIEGINADAALESVGKLDKLCDDTAIIDFVKNNLESANFQICVRGNNIGFKVEFNDNITYGSMANVVVYVNVDAQYRENNGYMIKEVRVEGDYSTTAGSGAAGSSISMKGRMSITLSEYWGDRDGNIPFPSFDGYKAGSLSDIKSFN
ncbi:MAG: hypothetical protein MSA34_03565 [Firmicutes bacterium]|nr:hypothetical protein [Bacillota bacterium]MDY5585701.1 hypothetical protein [Eubacteriales bacterium]